MIEEPNTRPETSEEAAGEGPPPGAEEVLGWKGFKLDDIDGAAVGKVEGVYVDSESGRPEWLLARMGRFGHHCLVPVRDAVTAGGHVWVPHGRDEIRRAPRQDPGEALEREAEQKLLSHYRVGGGTAGRGAVLAERAAGTVTARPA